MKKFSRMRIPTSAWFRSTRGNNEGDGDAPLGRIERAKRPDTRRRQFGGIEIAVGDLHDLAHRSELRHDVDDDRENRQRQRQRVRRQIVGIRGGPQAALTGNHDESSNHRLGREDADEDLEKGRYPGRTESCQSADQDHRSEKRIGRRLFNCGLKQRDKASQGEADAQWFHGGFSKSSMPAPDQLALPLR
ncbi:hypothetical protein MTX20_12760 [Bradyrhizobium sp. ISRA435]|nr:hypothetical protein MTX20_12760 [Bradyrhizobium sp. ISRA435]